MTEQQQDERARELWRALRIARKAADGDSNDAEIEAWQEVGDLIEAWLTLSIKSPEQGREVMPRAVPQFESFLSEDETADAFEAHGFVIISGRDARDGRGVALELTPRDARALGAWLLARDAYEAKHFDDSDLDTGD